MIEPWCSDKQQMSYPPGKDASVCIRPFLMNAVKIWPYALAEIPRYDGLCRRSFGYFSAEEVMYPEPFSEPQKHPEECIEPDDA